MHKPKHNLFFCRESVKITRNLAHTQGNLVGLRGIFVVTTKGYNISSLTNEAGNIMDLGRESSRSLLENEMKN